MKIEQLDEGNKLLEKINFYTGSIITFNEPENRVLSVFLEYHGQEFFDEIKELLLDKTKELLKEAEEKFENL